MSEPRRTARGPRPGRRQRRLGQNFLRDPNLLDTIVRESGVGPADVVLEVGGGAGVLTERLARAAGHVHLVEIDGRLAETLEPLAAELGNVELHWADALRVDLARLEPAPSAMVANLPYAIATPLLIETLALESVERWLVMVQREIADRLRAGPGTRAYGAPSALIQSCCAVRLVRKVGREVFSPPPRVDSALLEMRRTGPAPATATRALVREAFAHRRKALARSLELTGPGRRDAVLAALTELGLDPAVRAEALAPSQFTALADRLAVDRSG